MGFGLKIDGLKCKLMTIITNVHKAIRKILIDNQKIILVKLQQLYALNNKKKRQLLIKASCEAK